MAPVMLVIGIGIYFSLRNKFVLGVGMVLLVTVYATYWPYLELASAQINSEP